MSFAGFYGIADTSFGDPEKQVHLLLHARACAVQLRCKNWPKEQVEALAMRLFPVCQEAGIPLIINDLVLPHCSNGTHLGQEDGQIKRSDCPKGFLIGRSTHSLPQLRAAMDDGVDYAGFGPVYTTRTKQSAGAALGIEALQQATQLGLPLVAIGGITLDRLAEVQETGTTCWTAISAIWTAQYPAAALHHFNRTFD